MKGPGKLLSHRMLSLTFLCLWFATLIPLPKASIDTVAFILLQLYALTQRTFSQTYLHRQPIRPTPLGVSSLWVLCTKAAGKPSAIMYTKLSWGFVVSIGSQVVWINAETSLSLTPTVKTLLLWLPFFPHTPEASCHQKAKRRYPFP